MPEIVEVRVVAKTLKKEIVGKKIKRVEILYPRIIEGDPKVFVDTLIDKDFKDVKTCGKWLIFALGEYSILSHLRMEGKYYYVKSDVPYEKHTHIIFHLDNNMDLRYNDTRKFGRMNLVKTDEVYDSPSISKLGLEPDDIRLTSEYLLEKFKKVKLPIKTSLLDQTIINGLGNIYANEVLFASGIDPERHTESITEYEANKIIENSRRIIKKSFEEGGCTIRSYTSSLGVIGHYQDYLMVHGKEHTPCQKCNNPIEKVKIAGRSTYFCKNCQK